MQLGHAQAREIFAPYDIAVVPFLQVTTVEEGREAVAQLGGDSWVIRTHPQYTQKINSLSQLDEILTSIFTQVGHGPVYVEAKIKTQKCIYVCIELNNQANGFALIVYRNKEDFIRIDINPLLEMLVYQCRRVAEFLQLDIKQTKNLTEFLVNLYRLFREKDLILLELDPLLMSESGEFLVAANKLIVDERALFRQTIPKLDKTTELAFISSELGIRFYPSQGDIACIVNGRGMVLATKDMIKANGGKVASILDIGSNVAESTFVDAINLIINQEDIKVVLINIFGGFVRCDVLAQDITQALAEGTFDVPIVIRLEGTHAEQGRVLLKQTKYQINGAEDLAHGVEMAIKLAQ